jgi:RNA polymerase sigma-70 factor (ECF subfamily)
MIDERALVIDALKGELGAFEKIVDAYKNKLFSFLVKMTASRQDAEELLQEVFIRAYTQLEKYNDRWMFSTWIYRIALNTYRTWHKTRKRHQTLPIHEEIISGAPLDNPEEALEMSEQRREIVGLIQELREKQRIAMVLKYVKGFSYEEIGKILGISEEAAKMKVFRARESICKRYLSRHRGDLS